MAKDVTLQNDRSTKRQFMMLQKLYTLTLLIVSKVEWFSQKLIHRMNFVQKYKYLNGKLDKSFNTTDFEHNS